MSSKETGLHLLSVGDVSDLEQAARDGDEAAQRKYARYLEEVLGDTEKSLQFWKALAEKGDPKAMFHYGQYLVGCSSSNEQKKGWKYLQRAAAKGVKGAEYEYGVHLQEENRDLELAVSYVMSAAFKGHPKALYKLSVWEENVMFEKMSADLGDLDSMLYYGLDLVKNDHVSQKDNEEAVQYWKIGAKRGHHGCQYQYGMFLRLGTGVKQDQAKAAHYLKRAALSGLRQAKELYGVVLYLGQGVPRNYIVADHFLKPRADRGDFDYQVMHMDCQLHLLEQVAAEGRDVEEILATSPAMQDSSTSDDEYDDFSDYYEGMLIPFDRCTFLKEKHAIAENMEEVEGLCHLGKFDEAAAKCRVVANQGWPQASFVMASLLYQGKGVTRDVGEAKRYLTMAADQAYPGAAILLQEWKRI